MIIIAAFVTSFPVLAQDDAHTIPSHFQVAAATKPDTPDYVLADAVQTPPPPPQSYIGDNETIYASLIAEN